jgi:hypothetical protein
MLFAPQPSATKESMKSKTIPHCRLTIVTSHRAG